MSRTLVRRGYCIHMRKLNIGSTRVNPGLTLFCSRVEPSYRGEHVSWKWWLWDGRRLTNWVALSWVGGRTKRIQGPCVGGQTRAISGNCWRATCVGTQGGLQAVLWENQSTGHWRSTRRRWTELSLKLWWNMNYWRTPAARLVLQWIGKFDLAAMSSTTREQEYTTLASYAVGHH